MTIISAYDAISLTQALKSAQGGDTILLQPGVYSSIYLSKYNFQGGVTITSVDQNNLAMFTGLKVIESQGLTFSNLEFTTAFSQSDNPFQVSGSRDIHFDMLNVHGSLDGNPQNDVAAFLVRNSSDVSMTNSNFHELLFGFGMLDNERVTVSGNAFSEIRSDGVRGGGNSFVEITNNTFTNFRPGKGDHPDAIQFWTANTKMAAHDYLISGNVITRGDGAQVQGIFLGDESGGQLQYYNVTITDNLLVGTSWNGIALAGRQSSVTDNVLVAYSDEATAIRLQNADGILLSDNSAARYVYINATNVMQFNNLTQAAPTDLGLAAMAQWNAERGGLGLSQQPQVAYPQVPEATLLDLDIQSLSHFNLSGFSLEGFNWF